ncbi:MAG TPA: polysaccharide deacetylase family protein [Flavobacteriales bacterium]|nr:polysaccharide deacetylase family protein [Flavobacteriales bacterium]
MPFVGELKDRLWPLVKRGRLERDRLLGGNCVVLLYHRVIDLEHDPQLLSVSPRRFDEQLGLLKARYRVLSVEEFEHHLLNRKRFPKNSILITFDDGYADNHVHARPILEKHRLQGLFFIASGYIGSGREYWWDELERLFLLNPQVPVQLDVEAGGVKVQWASLPGRELLRSHYEQLLVSLRALPSGTRDGLLGALRDRMSSPLARPSHLPMDHAALTAFASSPSVVIGAHTVGHPSLGQIGEDEQRAEITRSKRDLEEWLGMPVTRFAYPFGTPSDFTERTMQITREAGFRHAAANHPGIAHARSPHFAYHRLLVRDWGGAEFLRHLSPYLW